MMKTKKKKKKKKSKKSKRKKKKKSKRNKSHRKRLGLTGENDIIQKQKSIEISEFKCPIVYFTYSQRFKFD
jgi:hypothetical protein